MGPVIVSVEFYRNKPIGKYACTVRLSDDMNDWSAIIENNRFSFLVKEAPYHLLNPGRCLFLFEGNKVVGKATVI